MSHKEYIKFLKSEIEKRDDKEELKKKMILHEEGSLFITSYRTTEEHAELVSKVGEKGVWFDPICTESEILRVLNPQSCRDIILSKQAEDIVDHCRTRRVFLRRKENLQKQGIDWSLESFYQKDSFYFNNYLQTMKPHVKRICKNVKTGFVYMIEPNGICEKTEHGNIIYLSESLKYFLHFMNFAFLDFLDFEMDVEQSHESLLIGLRVMLGVEALDFDLDPRYDSIPKDIVDANNAFVEEQIKFIIGHEYAHHSLGHLNNTQIRNISQDNIFKNSSNNIKIYNYAQKEEFEADWYAFNNTKMSKAEKAKVLNAAFLFFIYIDIYDYVKEWLHPSTNNFKTHPAPIERLWKLRKRIKNSIGYTSREIKDFIKYSDELKKRLAENLLPYKPETFEFMGSIYLSKYKKKRLIDRIDY